MNDVRNGKVRLNEKLLMTLSPYLDYTGMNNPVNKIYITVKSNIEYGSTFFFFVLAHLQKILPKNSSKLRNQVSTSIIEYMLTILDNISKEHIDGISFIMGIHTVLRQFNPTVNERFIHDMTQFTMLLTNQCLQ